jgi:hypothetical protein
MKHVTALLIKFVMIAVALEIVLNLLTDLTFGDILYIAAAVTLLAYVIGDLFILRATNNTVAAIADAGLALAVIYAFNFFWNVRYISFIDALIAAAVLGVGEWFFHKYVENNVSTDKEAQ